MTTADARPGDHVSETLGARSSPPEDPRRSAEESCRRGLRRDEREEGAAVTVASDARKRRSGQSVGLLPWDCPYCYEMLHELSRGWVCRRCRSTVGHGSRKPSADHVNRAENRVEESPR